MPICKHCKGTGKCDCHECKYHYRYIIERRLESRDSWEGECAKRADAWAGNHSVVVKCSVCNGTGEGPPGELSGSDESGFEDVED